MENKLKNILIISLTIFFNKILPAQQVFKTKGTIQYEWKVNNHRQMLSNWDSEEDDGDVWVKNWLENNPKFSTYYYTLKFNENKSLMTFKGRNEAEKKMWEADFLEDNIWFNDFNASSITAQKSISGRTFSYTDSIAKLNWKISTDDNREFVGFNCKKATAVLFDSVYVFAYYTDEIVPSVGPLTLSGLPGGILAITIPRLAVSIVATNFTPLVNESELVLPKKVKPKNKTELLKQLKESTEDWGRWGQRWMWNMFL